MEEKNKEFKEKQNKENNLNQDRDIQRKKKVSKVNSKLFRLNSRCRRWKTIRLR